MYHVCRQRCCKLVSCTDSQTRISLLDALSKGDKQTAWAMFYRQYAVLISNWCRRWGASAEDSEDIVQETLLVVFRKIAAFQYDPNRSFRSWLKKVAYRIWLRVFQDKKQASSSPESAAVIAKNDLRLLIAFKEFGDILDHVIVQEIHNIALCNVRKKVSERNWVCYQRCDIQNLEKTEVAAEMGISLGLVHVIVSRVRNLIESEIMELNKT